ncbi:MAG: MOSC domain-containing protein [Chloroflexi bacterium]|nr:MOSC domain-containing protein [Chloroflexota bacterium]
MVNQATLQELDEALQHILASPADEGRLEMISARPSVGVRELLEVGELDAECGLVGDNWLDRGSNSTPDGTANPEAQLTLINTRLIDVVAGGKTRWQLAGDQLFVDIDLSHDNLSPGALLSIGSAIIELTAAPHTGCVKFASRFGHDALRFVSGPEAMQQRRRGANAKIIQPGRIRVGDVVRKVEA